MSDEEIMRRVHENSDRLRKIELLIAGNGHLGIGAKVEIIWRSWVWVIGAGGVVVGYLIKDFLP